MTRYYFHLREGGEIVEDEEGSELPDLAAAIQHAIESARDIMADMVRSGWLDLSHAVLVVDDGGSVVATLPYREIVDVR